jgi:(p)ppGpp synthase/HD superfamily hydrolase
MIDIDPELQYPSIGRMKFLAALPDLPKPDFGRVELAYSLAKAAHAGSFRHSGERAFEHPRTVAWIIIRELGLQRSDLVIWALLHDALEDSFLLTPQQDRELARQLLPCFFGERIADGLVLLTHGRTQTDEDYVQGFYDPERASWKVTLVKLCDRLHNLRTLAACPPHKLRPKITETRDLYLPLADWLLEEKPADAPADGSARWLPKCHQKRGRYIRDQIINLCDQYDVALSERAA